MILSVNTDYFLEQRWNIDVCNGEVLCFLWGTEWILKCYLDELRPSSSKLLLHASSHAALPILNSSKLPPVMDADDLTVF
jgi:hypothetical protein